jgi:hypothetical protein
MLVVLTSLCFHSASIASDTHHACSSDLSLLAAPLGMNTADIDGISSYADDDEICDGLCAEHPTTTAFRPLCFSASHPLYARLLRQPSLYALCVLRL